MKENYTSITSQEQYNEVRTQIEELIHEATAKGMLDPEVDNEYIREIGKLAKLAAEYERYIHEHSATEKQNYAE